MTETPLRQCKYKENCVHAEAQDGWLPMTEMYFSIDHGHFKNKCRECNKRDMRLWHAQHKEEQQQYSRRYHTEHVEELRERNHRWREDNREWRHKYNRRRRLEDPEYYKRKHAKYQERERENWRDWYGKHRTENLERTARWRRKNRTAITEYSRNYYAQHSEERRQYARLHKDRMRIIRERRRARKRSLPDTLTINEWQHALDYFGGCCAACGCPPDFWTVIAADHWIPLAKGGGTIALNIVPLCHARKGAPAGKTCCNQSKWSKDPEQWLIECFGKRKAAEILKRINAYFESLR